MGKSYIQRYHGGKSGYGTGYKLNDDGTALIEVRLSSHDERFCGFEIELEFEDMTAVNEDDPDLMEYIDVYSEDYNENFEIQNPNYNPDKTGDLSQFLENLPLREEVGNCYDTYHFEEDGSLDNGFEVITQPMTVGAMEFWIRKSGIVETIKQSCGDNGTNGVHLHISKRKGDNAKFVQMLFYLQADRLRDLTRDSDYANFPDHDFSSASDLYYAMQDSDRDDWSSICDRGAFHEGNDKTWEFRLFNVPDYKIATRLMNYVGFAYDVMSLSQQYTVDDLQHLRIDISSDLNITATYDEDFWAFKLYENKEPIFACGDKVEIIGNSYDDDDTVVRDHRLYVDYGVVGLVGVIDTIYNKKRRPNYYTVLVGDRYIHVEEFMIQATEKELYKPFEKGTIIKHRTTNKIGTVYHFNNEGYYQIRTADGNNLNVRWDNASTDIAPEDLEAMQRVVFEQQEKFAKLKAGTKVRTNSCEGSSSLSKVFSMMNTQGTVIETKIGSSGDYLVKVRLLDFDYYYFHIDWVEIIEEFENIPDDFDKFKIGDRVRSNDCFHLATPHLSVNSQMPNRDGTVRGVFIYNGTQTRVVVDQGWDSWTYITQWLEKRD